MPNLTKGVEKRVILAGAPVRTPWALVYIHGFSATSEELRPVPDRVAQTLGANLIFTRLTGHGRDGDALAQATAAEWVEDMGEALGLARALGERVLLIGSSTGAGLMALAAQADPEAQDLAYVMISPNFALQSGGAAFLTMPFARSIVPLLAGTERSWEPENLAHGRYWTSTYPMGAVFPMAAVTQAARNGDYRRVAAPALVFLSDDDQVVRADVTRDVMGEWNRGAEIVAVTLGKGDDPSAHVIAGDILSPGQTDGMVAKILAWIEQL